MQVVIERRKLSAVEVGRCFNTIEDCFLFVYNIIITNIIFIMLKYFFLSFGIYLFAVINHTHCQTYSKETILISTQYGNMKVKLFNETPRHRDNFIKLVKKGFYDSLLFHRVISHFMIQGGDPDSKVSDDSATLGSGDVDYWIPAEFNSKLYHKKGMLAAAREDDDVNPGKESSGSQFYIVMGKTFDSAAISKAEIRVNKSLVQKINYNVAFSGKSKQLYQYYMRLTAEEKTDSLKYASRQLTDSVSISRYAKTKHFTFTTLQKKAYATIGGTPHLDMNYTVFGEVIDGLDVIDKIAAVRTYKNDRPKSNVRMRISIIKD